MVILIIKSRLNLNKESQISMLMNVSNHLWQEKELLAILSITQTVLIYHHPRYPTQKIRPYYIPWKGCTICISHQRVLECLQKNHPERTC